MSAAALLSNSSIIIRASLEFMPHPRAVCRPDAYWHEFENDSRLEADIFVVGSVGESYF